MTPQEIPPEFFDVFRNPLVWVFLIPLLVIGSAVPALLLKMAMSLLFREAVSFGLVLLIYALQAALAILLVVVGGNTLVEILLTPIWWVQTLIGVAWLAINSILFDLFVPNREGEPVATWKWAIGQVGAWALSVVFTVLAALAVFLLVNAANTGV